MGVYTVNQTDGSLQRVAGGTLYADAPIGAIQSYGGETAPAGWLICDGSTVSRTEYAELFAVIGINFGVGDGETTFGIPDLRECVPVGAGKNITKSIATHDRYDLGQFKDDALGTHNHPLVSVTTATFNTAGVPVGIGNNNTPTSATHGKQLGVNYIIKAKQIGMPTDFVSAVGDIVVDKNTYSTSETIVGKWIDGKPIYRRCFSGSGRLSSFSATLTNADIITNSFCTIKAPTQIMGGLYPLGLSFNSSTGVIVGSDDYPSSTYYHVIVEYTKTTDG